MLYYLVDSPENKGDRKQRKGTSSTFLWEMQTLCTKTKYNLKKDL